MKNRFVSSPPFQETLLIYTFHFLLLPILPQLFFHPRYNFFFLVCSRFPCFHILIFQPLLLLPCFLSFSLPFLYSQLCLFGFSPFYSFALLLSFFFSLSFRLLVFFYSWFYVFYFYFVLYFVIFIFFFMF